MRPGVGAAVLVRPQTYPVRSSQAPTRLGLRNDFSPINGLDREMNAKCWRSQSASLTGGRRNASEIVEGRSLNQESFEPVPEKKTPRPNLIDPKILKAQSHPIRASILNILSEGPSSPSRMHRRMEDEASLRLISYHCGVLARADLIELVEIKRSGGREEHIYRTMQRQHFNIEEWMAIDPRYRDPIITSILKQISEDTGRAMLEGKFSQIPDSHLSRSPVEVDQEGWAEVLGYLDTALGGIMEAHAKSAERAQKSGEEKLPIRVVMMQFPIGREPTRK